MTARSFARPPVTAEIAAGLAKVGGILVVSEPPEADAQRWPDAALVALGFAVPLAPVVARGAHFVCLTKIREAGVDVPRPVGRPAKRPLW